MWALFVVVFYVATPGPGKTAGSFELRMSSHEQCLVAKERFEKTWNYDKHRIYASCTFKGYL